MTPAQKQWFNNYRHTLNKIGKGFILDCNGGTIMKYTSNKRLSPERFQQTIKQERNLGKIDSRY